MGNNISTTNVGGSGPSHLTLGGTNPPRSTVMQTNRPPVVTEPHRPRGRSAQSMFGNFRLAVATQQREGNHESHLQAMVHAHINRQ